MAVEPMTDEHAKYLLELATQEMDLSEFRGAIIELHDERKRLLSSYAAKERIIDRLKAEVERLESDVEKLTSDVLFLREDVP